MKNKSIKKRVTINLIIAILFAVGFVGGIPLIIISATNGFTFGLILGIILVALGFYGTPLQFLHFANLKSVSRVVDAILVENIYSVNEIAEHLRADSKTVAQQITYAVNHEYLLGYKFDGNTLSVNDSLLSAKKATRTNKCPNCGGIMTTDEYGSHCPYCNSTFLN